MFSFQNYPSKLEKKGTENCDSETKIPHTKPCNSTAPSIFIYILCNRSIAKKFGFIWFQNKALHKNYMMGNFAPPLVLFLTQNDWSLPTGFPSSHCSMYDAYTSIIHYDHISRCTCKELNEAKIITSYSW